MRTLGEKRTRTRSHRGKKKRTLGQKRTCQCHWVIGSKEDTGTRNKVKSHAKWRHTLGQKRARLL